MVINHNEPVAHSAMKIWPILVDLALNYRTITYGRLEKLTGVYLAGPSGTSEALPLISWYCRRNRLPNLAVLVVLQDTGQPGKGFFLEDARIEEGMPVEQKMRIMTAREAEIRRARESVFKRKWLEVHVPTLEEFEEELRRMG